MVEGAPLEAGVILGGKYRVIRPLAEGGVGVVFEVEHIATAELRAIEVMRSPFGADDGLRARFVREACLAASIPSDHVARVLDAGQDESTGALYVVTELLDGDTLSSVLRRRGPYSWGGALAILRQVADALSAAHAMGIVHRGLEPPNVFLARSRRAPGRFTVKIVGFGIAVTVSSARAAAAPADSAPGWTAPERNAATTTDGAVGPQADIWSFGLLAFVLLTGKHYFPSATLDSPPNDGIREAALDDLVPASERAAQMTVDDRLPPGFDVWFARCVQHNPRTRFHGMREAYEALAGLTPLPAVYRALPLQSVTPPDTSGVPAESRALPPPALSTAHIAATPTSRGRRWGPSWIAQAGFVGIALAALVVWGVRARQAMTSTAAAQAVPVTSILVRLHGSNTIGAELAPALAEAFLRRHTPTKTVVHRRAAPDEILVEARDEVAGPIEAIEIAAHGSSTAFEDLRAGRCDIGMSSRRIHDDEKTKLAALGDLASAASEQVIALDGIAVIVNPTNPVSLLTKAQIADVFAGKIRDWSEVGGRNERIFVHTRNDKSGTYDTFKHLVLGERAMAADAKRYESSDELSDAVAADADAVGFIGLPYVRSAKPVMVQDEGSVPLLPSPMTVSTEDYALARRLYLYVPLGAPLAAREFVDFAQSEEGQKVVAAAGFVDLRPECDPRASQCTACGREYRALVSGACRLSTNFRFDRGSSQPDTRALRDLQRVSTMMDRPEYATKSILLLGFSDARGGWADNLALSQLRASTVATQLRARRVHVLTARGFGPTMPISDNATEDGRERNRRVEVWLR
jgi:phosphate transport system substrate-binding protein